MVYEVNWLDLVRKRWVRGEKAPDVLKAVTAGLTAARVHRCITYVYEIDDYNRLRLVATCHPEWEVTRS